MTEERASIIAGWCRPKRARAWHAINKYGVSLCLRHESRTDRVVYEDAPETGRPLCKRCLAAVERG